jgi:uncharacterized membrane protein YfcA
LNSLPSSDVPIGNVILMFSIVPGAIIAMCYSRHIKESGLGTVVAFAVLAIAFIPIFLLRAHLQHVAAGPWGAFQRGQMEFWAIISFSAGIVSIFMTLGIKTFLERKRIRGRNV